jgi:hypothetical protein
LREAIATPRFYPTLHDKTNREKALN